MPSDEAELERIYMAVLRKDPDHRLAQLHELVQDGVSFNISEQIRDLLAEEITALDPEQGEHRRLLADAGTYAAMWELQQREREEAPAVT